MAKSSPLDQLKDLCQKYLVTKAPYTLPLKAREAIVKFAPWVTVIVFVLTLPLVLAVFGIGFFFLPYVAVAYGGPFYTVGLILLGITVILELMAVPGLFKRELRAWNFLYYAVLIRAVAELIRLDFVPVIFAVVSLYILFQVKSLYKS